MAGIVPILSPFRSVGGTFYTFSSSVNDSALLFSNDNVRISFSKFACLNLPDWKNQTEQRLFRDAADIGAPTITDPNSVFVKAYLQNYSENLQNFAEADRTDQTFQNFAEASFFKALRHVSDTDVNADPATSSIQLETSATYVKPDNTIGQSYIERADSVDPGNTYEQVIQYVGNINTLNFVRAGSQEYLEIYAPIQRDFGKSIGLRLKPNDSFVFANGQIPSGGGEEYIEGRETEFNANTDNVHAIYDNVGSRLYDVSSDIENLGIDFSEYEGRANDDLRYSKDRFEYNCVLLYYDIWDSTDETTRRRNLYGVLFLDRFATDGGTSSIQSLIKYAPSLQSSGNSYAHRFNLKFSNFSNQVTSEITVGNELIGLELYNDALARLTTLTAEYQRLTPIVAQQQADINILKLALLQQN